MTCPICHRTATTFVRFVFMIDPRSIHCDHCGAELRLSPSWLRNWWLSLIVGTVVVLASIVLRRIIGWGLWTNLAGLVVLATIISWYFWRSAAYQVKVPETRPSPDLELP